VSAVEVHHALHYDGAMMRRVVKVMQVAFWTSVPLFAVYLAVTPRDGRLGWPGVALLYVVLVSSAFLTARLALPASSREEGVELAGSSSAARRVSEWLVYAIVLYLAVYFHSGYMPCQRQYTHHRGSW
jgi:hypothetical protein